MNSCVNKNKEFYSLAEEHGIDGNELELIVHKYWNEVGKEDSFPPSSYINEQLGIGKSYDETSENVRKLWEKDYSRPIKFKSEYELNGAVQKAKTFFPADTITTYKDNKGNFVLRVAEPVTTFDNVTNSSSISYIGQEAATARVQSFIDSIDKSGEYGQAIQEFIDTFGIPVVNEVIFNITQANTHSSSWNNFTRALKLGFSEMASSEEKAAVTLHELIHSRTTSLANLYEKVHGIKSLKPKGKSKAFESLPSDALTPEIEKAFDNIVECKAEVLKYLEENPEIKETLLSTNVTTNLNKRPLYAILKETNKYGVKEFISEIYTNPAFIQLLKSIPTKVKKQSLWDKFVNALRSIFGKKKAYISVLDRARENADVIVRAGNNVNTSFETISEDASSLPIGQQRAQLRNYYASLQTRSSQEFKQVRALASQAFKSQHTFTSESAAKAIADNYIRDNHIDSDMVAYTYGYKVPNQQFFVPVIKWKSDAEYANAKHVSAGDYVNSLTNSEVESEVLRLSTDEEMFDSTFTFNDGTTIDTPFELNDQQKAALQKLDDFAKDKSKTAITLSGYAGTGKTSLMEMVAKKLGRRHNVVFSATTHQAAGVLKSKVGKYGFETKTVNSLFGITVETDMEGKTYDMSKMRRVQAEPKLHFGDIVVLDEASMLSDENYNDVVSIAKMYNAKVIFVGDKAQLAPVGQNEVSKVFRDSNGEVVELTKVERTGDNAILSEATAIRNGQNFTYESAFNAQGQGVAYVTPQSTDIISSIIETFTPGLKTNPNYLRILAFTNASVANYNSKVRQSLGYNGLTPQVGEPMLGYANWGYDRSRAASGDPYQFVNSRSYKVVATQAPYKSGVRLSDGTVCSFDILPLRLEDSMGEQVTVPFIDIKNNVQNRNSAKLAAQEKAILWTKWRTAQGMQKNILLKTINELEDFLFINDNLTGDQNNLLQAKVIDFGYAHTIHKSQGGTYTHVIMDDGGIESSRSSAEMKQQLKYVGVSRATDTVTIISPQTKKADSPINHMQVGPEEVNNSNIAPTRPQNTQTESINIYAGTGENAHLSNFAIRPFTHTWSNGNTMQMQSVEQAFQIAKAATAKDTESIRKMQQTTDGATLRKLGRAIKGLDVEQWDANKANWMKVFIKESFMQNPKALEQLLATGNATLTHNQDRSAWGQMFPQILMQVREELRNYTPAESPLIQGVKDLVNSVESLDKDLVSVSKELRDKYTEYVFGFGEFTEADAKRFLEEVSSKKQQFLIQSKPFSFTFVDAFGNEHEEKFFSLEQAMQYARMDELFIHFIGMPSGLSYYGKGNATEEYARIKSLIGTIKHKILKAKTAKELEKISDIKPTSSNASIQRYIDYFFEDIDRRDFLGKPLPTNIWERMKDDWIYSFKSAMEEQNALSQKISSPILATPSQNIHRTLETIAEFENSPKPEANNAQEQRAPEVFNDNKTSVDIVSSNKTILSNEELQQWNEAGLGEKPRILVASEHTDPVFHVNKILDILEGKSSVNEWGIVNGKRQIVGKVSGKDFAGLYLVTKHDGLPMKRILETKIPKLIHFSITSLGGTKYEPGVMKANDLLDRIGEYIKQGLDPKSITIRIDPIVPGVTTKEEIENIVKRASEMGIRRIRFSIMDAYPNTQLAMEKLGYDFSQYYTRKADGKYNFFANTSYIEDMCNFMLSLKDKYNVTLGTCAEAIAKNGISKEGCLSVSSVNEMLGTSIEDKGTANNEQRKLCSCYGGKIDALQYNSNCASHCVYCYAKHENDIAMQYYNEDGTLKDNDFTRTLEEAKKKHDAHESFYATVPPFETSNISTSTSIIPEDAKTVEVDGKIYYYTTEINDYGGRVGVKKNITLYKEENGEVYRATTAWNKSAQEIIKSGVNWTKISTKEAAQVTPPAPSTSTTDSVTTLPTDSNSRVKEAKLLNKQQIVDAIIEDGKLYINTSIQGYNSNHIQGQITFDKGRWNYRTVKVNSVSWEQLTQEETDFLNSTAVVDRDLQNQAIDKYIPKDLQDYYLSGKNKEDNQAYIEASGKLQDEHPDWKINDRIAALMNTSLDEANYVRDTWGIYSYNPYTKNYAWNIRIAPSTQTAPDKIITVTTEATPYRKGLPQQNPNIAYVFTENAEAYAYTNSIDLESQGVKFPNPNAPKINVSDVNGTNQAGIRTDARGNISKNAFGIVVKKFQQDANGRFVAKEGQFQDTDTDFELFKSLNEDMFDRLEKSGLNQIVFPSQMALGKAALPLRFANWLAKELYDRYGVTSTIEQNTRADYEGYGLHIEGQVSSTSTPLQDPRVSLAEHAPSQQGTTNMLPPISPSDVDTTTPANQIPNPNPDGPLKGFTLHSGGAIGADFAWGNIGASYGVSGKHYFDATDTREGKRPPYGNTPITDEERTLGERKAFHAGKQMGRLSSKAQKVADPLLIRDWNQVNNADMVVAIAQKFDMPGDKFSNKSDDERRALVQQVSGGTGWAVQMAISEGKPVFVFNQADGLWRYFTGAEWVVTETPVLSENFAGIGTRGINAVGEAAIRMCYEKTVAAINNQFETSTVEEITTQVEKSFDIESLSPEMRKEFYRLTKRTAQIDNILSSGVMTSIEAREIVDSLMNRLSDYISEIINDPSLANTALKESDYNAWLNTLLVAQTRGIQEVVKPFDPTGMSRLDIINKIGIDNLVQQFLKKEVLTAKRTTTRPQAKKMRVFSQNLDALLYLGANTLSINEGIHLTTTRVNGKEMKTMEEGVVINSDLNSARDLESMQENEGSLQEKWQVDSRTIDVVESMSQLVRNELFKLYQLDSNGNKITNGIGIYKRVPVQETTKQLLSWLQGCLTLSDVVARLKDKQATNPWVKQLIDVLDVEALGESAGQHTDFQNSFFSVFNKHFQSYSATTITYDKDGVQHIKRIPLNEKPFLKETLGQIKVDIASGIHPLFTAKNGVNQLAFENFKTVLDTLHTIGDNKIAKIGFDKMSSADRQLAFEAISQAASLLGYPTDATTLGNLLNGRDIRTMITHLDNMYDDILANINNPSYEPLTFTKGEGGKKGSGIRGSLSKFLEPLTNHLADISVSTIFDSGKMYQSHVTPSYMTKLMLKFHQTDPVKFDQFIQEEFGKYDWFRDTSIRDTKAGWRNGWIGILARDAAARKVFKHEAKLNYNKHNYMKNMTGNEYIMSLLSSFFSEGAGNGREDAVAWYRIPILSNKPSEEYIRFYADMGQDYKEVISTKMAKVFNQELSRIQTVRMQNYDKSDPRFIKSFHENGKRFCFLDFMNVYLEGGERANTELGKLLKAKLEDPDWNVANEPRLLDLAKQAIQHNMQIRINEILKDYEKRGIMEIAENIEGIKQGFGKDNIAENIERFLWNDAYAATQILQLTVTDIAYYKDMEDLQKRIAQIHAPGIRGNADAIDYEGNPVSDGFERTMYLTDFAGVKSNIIDNVKIVFDRKLEELRNQPLDNFSNTKLKTDEDVQRAAEAKKQRIMIQEELYNNILKQFEDINVADAQGYSSPTSYRKKMFIFGKWSKEAENIYQKLLTGDYNYHDLQVAFQPLKPFVYSQIEKPIYLEKSPLKSLKMPIQNKNSEYLLIMADAILQGENTGQPNLLRAIYEVMEESAKASPTKGIDTVQFESTVKSGLMGRNDINRVLEGGKWNELIEVKDPNTGKTVKRTRGEAAAKAYLQNNLYIKNEQGKVIGYNPIYVHEIPFEDYCIQQEVPEHFKDHDQQHGSQIRMITPSDLLSVDTYGNPVTYNVEGRGLSAKEFRKEYEQTIADNIQQSIDEVFKELHLDATNQVEKNIILSRMLQDEILSSPRYGLDMYLACSLDPVTGEFRIPLGDPIQANRIEQLLNSIIKKRVNEQKIAGGPVVQVSNFGTSRRLNIRFKDRNGGLLKTRDEFTKDWKPSESTSKMNVKSLANKLMKEEKLSYMTAIKEAKRRIEESQNAPQQTADEAYEKYIKNNQGGIAYFEVFAPIFNDDIFHRFANPDGTIDIATMEKVCPEALQMIGYRIPTEDKYSCAPIKIVGFLPREAGEGIMLPYDITLLTGSDFDKHQC